MTPAYINCVKRKFEVMRNSGEIIQALVNPTRASIRDECLRLYPTRSGQKDKKTLADFFRHDEADGTLFETIERVDLESLKALQNFLSEQTHRPNYRVVEMLAWLIDFQPRPYDSSVNYKSDNPAPKKEDTVDEIEDIDKGTNTTVEPIHGVEKTRVFSKKIQTSSRKPLVFALALSVIAVGGYKLGGFDNRSSKQSGCMYWTGDHFERIACRPTGGDTVAVSFDYRLINFKRITTPDTITLQSLEKLWYLKRNGSLEFYESDGFHPLELRRQLKPLTPYIFEKYLK